MSENSKIEWTDHTFNPWIGCTKVSPGCANCYAETQDKFRSWTPQGWGKGKPRKRTSGANWLQPLKWNSEDERKRVSALHSWPAGKPMPWRRPRVFCASLADWLDDEVPIEWLVDLLELIRNTPHLDWLLLTKRPSNWKIRIGLAARHVRERGGDMGLFCAWGHGEAPENIWIGTTVENQEMAEKRIAELDAIPARVRFLSCEPLLGPVNLSLRTDRIELPDCIHWVICGGESGSNARPMHPDWARSLRDQCQAAGVPFFFKQWGEWCPRGPSSLGYPAVEGVPQLRMTDAGEDGHRLEARGDNQVWMNRAGKKSAGRLLDGREWNEFPTGKEVAA